MAILRRIPLCMAIFQFIYIISQFFGYNYIWLNYIFFSSLLTLVFLYIASFLLKFCYYHRVSLHYVTITNIICIIDKYIGLPLDLVSLFIIHMLIFIWLCVSLIYFRYKERNNCCQNIDNIYKELRHILFN